VECLTDNRNRSASDVRVAMTRNGGRMADAGSVSYLFNRKGVVVVEKDQDGRSLTEDDLLETALEAGAEDVNDLGEAFEIISDAGDLVQVRQAVEGAGLDYDSAEVSFVPSVTVEVDGETVGKIYRLIEALEDSEDVQNVYANFDAPEEAMAGVR
jgi:YebC/PmpR family DNA-binding regulatory protein